jgi:hypothetical protein
MVADYTAKEFFDLLDRHGFERKYAQTGSILIHLDTPGRQYLMQKSGETRRDAMNRLHSEYST